MNKAKNNSESVDMALSIPNLQLRSLNGDLRGVTFGARMAGANKAKQQRAIALMACSDKFGKPPKPPIVITITRVAPGALDSDNLASSAKHVRDGVADWLGLNDNDKRLRWEYSQRKEGRKCYGVEIRIQSLRLWLHEFVNEVLPRLEAMAESVA